MVNEFKIAIERYSFLVHSSPFADKDGKEFKEKQASKQDEAASTFGHGMGREKIP
jgi:hypothetical protein